MKNKLVDYKNYINKSFLNLKLSKKYLKIFKDLNFKLKESNNVLNTFNEKYKYSFKKKKLESFKKYSEINLIGMGGSILGSEAIYDFLNYKIKKKFHFFNNLQN